MSTLHHLNSTKHERERDLSDATSRQVQYFSVSISTYIYVWIRYTDTINLKLELVTLWSSAQFSRDLKKFFGATIIRCSVQKAVHCDIRIYVQT